MTVAGAGRRTAERGIPGLRTAALAVALAVGTAAFPASSVPAFAGGSEGASGVLVAQEAEPDPASLLERASERYASVDGFCASFTQERIVPLLNQTTRSSGTLCQMDPGYFLMDFDDPEGDRVVSDGRYLWLFYPSTNPGQVVRTRLGGGDRTFDFHREFLDDPSGRFEVRWVRRDTVTGRPTDAVELRPLDDPTYVRATVWLDTERGLIRKVEIEEENESLRRIVLSDIELEPGLEPSRFRFEPPADVEVIRRDAGPAPGG